MSASSPCLIGIALVIKKKTEPHLIFHYPPRPGEDDANLKSLFKDDSVDTTSSSSDDEESAPEEEELVKEETECGAKSDSPPDIDEPSSLSPEKGSSLQQVSKKPLWNDVFGYKANVLAKALCPAKGGHRRFEMSLANNVVLGRPVYAKEDGQWRRKRRQWSSSVANSGATNTSLAGDKTIGKSSKTIHEASEDSSYLTSDATDEFAVTDEPGDHDLGEGLGSKRPSHEGADHESTKVVHPKAGQEGVKDNMVMFHVVFCLRPPPLEYHARVHELYEQIVKRFTRALKWEQARSGYVAQQASLISSVAARVLSANRDNPPLATLYHQLISQSSLAKGMATLYNGISNSKIAHINLTSTTSLSLQIPLATSISILPTPLTPQKPGLRLTTATALPADQDVQHSGSRLSPHFTLLLLSDVRSILADVDAAASPVSGLLTHYLYVCKPTKSFLQTSQTSGISLPDIQLLASHLIYWRRAWAISPLRQSDNYIVSPNADMQDLPSASSRFAKAFPMMPPLPRILSMLSATPKPYSTFIPNKDRKEVFMEILAWMLRGGWVTQLQTFVWVRIPPLVKTTVDAQFRKDGEQETSEKGLNGVKSYDFASSKPNTLENSDTNSISSTSSANTALRIDNSPSAESAAIICNPQLASGLHSRYLSALSTHVGESQGADSRAAWDRCLKYFDGKHAVESIAVREAWKRKRVMELVAGWEGLGILNKVRHW